jgi:hypothetical protein
VTGDDDAVRVAAELGRVAMHPRERLHHLQHDVLDADRRAQRVAGQHDHRARRDERRRDEALVALAEGAPVATVDVDQHRRARCLRREDVELLGRVGSVGAFDHLGMPFARPNRFIVPMLQDHRVLRNARAVVVLLVVPGRCVSAHRRLRVKGWI